MSEVREVYCRHEPGPAGRGGFTVVIVASDQRYHCGVALCSRKDQYAKQRGRQIATGRALKAARLGTEFYVPEMDNEMVYAPVAAVIPLRFNPFYSKPEAK